MTSQIQTIAGGVRTDDSPPAPQTGLDREPKRRFASKILAMTGVLQTTLETNELINLFARELARFVRFDGISYQLSELRIDISLGRLSKHSCSYQLIVSGEALGELRMFRSYPFQQGELETVENLLSGLLYPLRNALLYHRAVQSALIDPLTGVKNRSTMDHAMHREIELSRRQGRSLSVILLDIDHFKQINDRFGHLYGDQALRAVAQCTEKSIRDSDMLFRYGGEEFLILLSGTSLDGTRMLAERIRREVETLQSVSDHQLQVTVSLGVTELREQDDAKGLFERADTALYQAKQAGRNRVEVMA